MESILQNLSHETEPSAQKDTAAPPPPQRKLTIRLPAGSTNSCEAAAEPQQKDVDAILRNLAGYRPPPPGPQMFGPPPKARAKPTLQRTTPRAPDAGPSARSIFAHDAARACARDDARRGRLWLAR